MAIRLANTQITITATKPLAESRGTSSTYLGKIGAHNVAVIRILNDMARQFETAIIVVTHDEKIIPTFKRIYHIRDGVTHEEAGEARDFE